jgi:hypothetical protein
VYLRWSTYCKTVSTLSASATYIGIVWSISAVTGEPFVWFLLLFGLFISLFSTMDIPRAVPDHLHMRKKMSYRVIDGCIYVKLPLSWVVTEYDSYDGNLEKFQEKKLEYIHSGKGKTFRV